MNTRESMQLLFETVVRICDHWRGRHAGAEWFADLDSIRRRIAEREKTGGALPNPCDAVEFIDEKRQRWAWSESNVRYEPVSPDGGSFTLLRDRLDRRPYRAITIEIRDRSTFIPAIAVECSSRAYLCRRAGFVTERGVALVHLQTEDAKIDPYSWGSGSRTMQVAHNYVCEHFDDLEDGAVVDVEFIVGEAEKPKTSERDDGVPA